MRRSIADRTALAISESDSGQLRRRFEERKATRNAARERYFDLLEKVWDAGDAVYACEQVLKKEAPEWPEDGLSERMKIALRHIDEMRAYRDGLTDEMEQARRDMNGDYRQ